MIVVEGFADDRLLEAVKSRPIVNFAGALMPGEKRAGPIIDEVIAEWSTIAIGQTCAGLPQQIGEIGHAGNDDPGMREFAREVARHWPRTVRTYCCIGRRHGGKYAPRRLSNR